MSRLQLYVSEVNYKDRKIEGKPALTLAEVLMIDGDHGTVISFADEQTNLAHG